MGLRNLSKTAEKVPQAHVQREYLEELIGYEAHPGLISLCVCLSVHLSVCLSGMQKHVDFEHRN
jgi:hypothetical protein